MDLKFRIPLKKMEEIKELIHETLAKRKTHIKAMAKIVGKVISFARSIGPIARVMTRAIHRVIAKVSSWNCTVKLDKNAKKELFWWLSNIEDVSDFTIK